MRRHFCAPAACHLRARCVPGTVTDHQESISIIIIGDLKSRSIICRRESNDCPQKSNFCPQIRMKWHFCAPAACHLRARCVPGTVTDHQESILIIIIGDLKSRSIICRRKSNNCAHKSNFCPQIRMKWHFCAPAACHWRARCVPGAPAGLPRARPDYLSPPIVL